MCTDRVTARIVGVLFIVATVTASVGGALVAPVTGFDAPQRGPGPSLGSA